MIEASEPLFAASDAVPSLWAAALRLGLGVFLIVCAGAAWVWWQRRFKGPTRQLEVLDRAVLARGASVALLRVKDRQLLVGVSSEGVRLIRDLDAAAGDSLDTRFAAMLEGASARDEVNP